MIRNIETAQASRAHTPPTIRLREWKVMPPSQRSASETVDRESVSLCSRGGLFRQERGERTCQVLLSGITHGPAHSGWGVRGEIHAGECERGRRYGVSGGSWLFLRPFILSAIDRERPASTMKFSRRLERRQNMARANLKGRALCWM
jgi:hypothetical protein